MSGCSSAASLIAVTPKRDLDLTLSRPLHPTAERIRGPRAFLVFFVGAPFPPSRAHCSGRSLCWPCAGKSTCLFLHSACDHLVVQVLSSSLGGRGFGRSGRVLGGSWGVWGLVLVFGVWERRGSGLGLGLLCMDGFCDYRKERKRSTIGRSKLQQESDFILHSVKIGSILSFPQSLGFLGASTVEERREAGERG